jgi:hypothetical protein
VQHQLLELAQLAVTQLCGLSPRRIERDHDLAEQEPAVRQRIAVGKGQDVGGPVELAIGAIEALQLLVAGHHDMYLRLQSARAPHDLHDDPPQGLSRRLRGPSIPPEVDPCHACVASG